MSVLITGAGLIGCHFAQRALRAGRRVVLYDLAPKPEYISAILGQEAALVVAGDLRDLPSLFKTMTDHKITTVVHTAGLIGGKVAENSYTGITGNILGTIHVLEASRLLGVTRLVYVSSRAAYDASRMSKGVVSEDSPVGGNGAYGATKACSEIMIQTYARLYQLDSIILRPSAVFGRGHFAGGSSVGLRMQELAVSLLEGRPFAIDAGVYPENEYVYVKDVAAAIESACDVRKPIYRVYNIGTGTVVSAPELYRIVRESFPSVDVALSGGAERQTDRAPMDLARAREELGYTPRYPLAEALKDYVADLRSNPSPVGGSVS